MILDGAVIGLLRMVIGESDKFPEIADTFYNKAIKRTESTLANWLKAQAERGLIAIDNADRGRRHAARHARLPAAARRDARPRAAPTRDALERRAQVVAKLFLQGCARQQ